MTNLDSVTSAMIYLLKITTPARYALLLPRGSFPNVCLMRFQRCSPIFRDIISEHAEVRNEFEERQRRLAAEREDAVKAAVHGDDGVAMPHLKKHGERISTTRIVNRKHI